MDLAREESEYRKQREKEDKAINETLHFTFKKYTKRRENCLILCATHQIARYYYEYMASVYTYSHTEVVNNRIFYRLSALSKPIYIQFRGIPDNIHTLVSLRNTWIIPLPGAFENIPSYKIPEYDSVIRRINERIISNG